MFNLNNQFLQETKRHQELVEFTRATKGQSKRNRK